MLVECLNTQQEKKETIYVRIGEKVIVIDKDVIIDVFKISNIGWRGQKHVDEKQTNLEAMLQGIALPWVYINTCQWNVSKMKPPYDVHIRVLIQIVYQRNKTCIFSNMNGISMMMANKEKSIDWIDIMFR